MITVKLQLPPRANQDNLTYFSSWIFSLLFSKHLKSIGFFLLKFNSQFLSVLFFSVQQLTISFFPFGTLNCHYIDPRCPRVRALLAPEAHARVLARLYREQTNLLRLKKSSLPWNPDKCAKERDFRMKTMADFGYRRRGESVEWKADVVGHTELWICLHCVCVYICVPLFVGRFLCNTQKWRKRRWGKWLVSRWTNFNAARSWYVHSWETVQTLRAFVIIISLNRNEYQEYTSNAGSSGFSRWTQFSCRIFYWAFAFSTLKASARRQLSCNGVNPFVVNVCTGDFRCRVFNVSFLTFRLRCVFLCSLRVIDVVQHLLRKQKWNIPQLYVLFLIQPVIFCIRDIIVCNITYYFISPRTTLLNLYDYTERNPISRAD